MLFLKCYVLNQLTQALNAFLDFHRNDVRHIMKAALLDSREKCCI